MPSFMISSPSKLFFIIYIVGLVKVTKLVARLVA